MDPAYQQIWDADQGANGIPALRPGEASDQARGFVVVDERADNVPSDHKVLKQVHIPDTKLKTYELCAALFDNYALLRAAPEIVRSEETQEEVDFVSAILGTAPIQKAKKVLEDRLQLTISDDKLAIMIQETWFKMGDAGSQKFASGFEHVFVGEQAKKEHGVGGYHYWHKYFLDDGGAIHGEAADDRINYLGTRFGGPTITSEGVQVPEVVTLSLQVEAPLGDHTNSGDSRGGAQSKTLTKPIGGFFVGCSPECLIALGLVRCRTPSGKITKINGAEYELSLHRLDDEPNSIRTFYPRFRKADVIGITPADEREEDDGPIVQPVANSPFRMIAALVNPINPEGGREFIQILNSSAAEVSLAGWSVTAPNGLRFHIADVPIQAGEVFKFVVPSNQSVLRNKAGRLQLLQPSGDVAHAVNYTTEQAKREGEPIMFV